MPRPWLTVRYAPACIKLLAQYKSLMKLVGDDIGGVEAFMRRFKVHLGRGDRALGCTELTSDGSPSGVTSLDGGRSGYG
jgi:hypothetical protein